MKHCVVGCPLCKPSQEQRAIRVWRPWSYSTSFTAWERYPYKGRVKVQVGLPKMHFSREAFLMLGASPTSLLCSLHLREWEGCCHYFYGSSTYGGDYVSTLFRRGYVGCGISANSGEKGIIILGNFGSVVAIHIYTRWSLGRYTWGNTRDVNCNGKFNPLG